MKIKENPIDLTELTKKLFSLGHGEPYHLYNEYYEKFPSAKSLTGERYTNFMSYKINFSYNKVREKYPDLPEL